jgi:hypothetical protein
MARNTISPVDIYNFAKENDLLDLSAPERKAAYQKYLKSLEKTGEKKERKESEKKLYQTVMVLKDGRTIVGGLDDYRLDVCPVAGAETPQGVREATQGDQT